jgi:hypothetical protein
MAEEPRQARSIKIKPSILRKAHHRAIESQKRLGEWIEEAIEWKASREAREGKHLKRLLK